MRYPKFSQRYLAWFVLCFLLLALGAVAITFLLSIAAHSSTANIGGTERYDILLPQHVSGGFAKLGGNNQQNNAIARTWNDNSNEASEEEDSLKTKDKGSRFSQEEHDAFTNGVMHKLNYDDYNGEQQKLLTQADDADFELEDMEQQNIYIDEFDKPNIEITDRSKEYKQQIKQSNDDGSDYFTNGDDISSSESESESMDDKSEIREAVTVETILEQNIQLPKYKKMVPFRQFGSANLQQDDEDEDNKKKNDHRLQQHGMAFNDSDSDDNNDVDDGDLENFSGSGGNKPIDNGYDDETTNFIQRISLKMKENFKRVGDGEHQYIVGSRGRKNENEHHHTRAAQRNSAKPDATEKFALYRENKKMRKLQKLMLRNNPGLYTSSHGIRNSASINSIIHRKSSGWPESTNSVVVTQSQNVMSHTTPTTPAVTAADKFLTKYYNSDLQQPQPESAAHMSSLKPAWLETRTRRIIGNVEKSEERSRQLLLCEKEESGGGGELCRMLFKHLND